MLAAMEGDEIIVDILIACVRMWGIRREAKEERGHIIYYRNGYFCVFTFSQLRDCTILLTFAYLITTEAVHACPMQ